MGVFTIEIPMSPSKFMEKPRPASIVMPLLSQRDEWLEQSLLSALGQTIECEVLVITSPKTPNNNLDVLERIGAVNSNMQIHCRDQHQNFAGAINLGIQLASSERIGLLFCDDWLRENAVERCLPNATDIVSTGSTIFDADGKRVIIELKPTGEGFLARPTLERKAAYLKHFYLFRRDKLREVGGVDEEIGLTGADDFDMIWTLLEQGATVSVVEESLHCYRDHSDIRLTLRSRNDQIRDITKIFRKHGVPESEISRLIALHADWFGSLIQDVLRTRTNPAPD